MAATSVAAPSAPPGATPAGKPPRGRHWLRRLLIGINVFVAVCLLAAATLYGYVWFRFGQINRVSVASLTKRGSGGYAGGPVNILVVGSDSRAFVKGGQDVKSFGNASQAGGARSDTTMIVHLDPGSGTTMLMSVPRDLWVPIAGKTYSQRINTAFDSGPDELVRTIQQDLGIPINHYVDADFQTFRDVVAALEGVKFWYPEPVHDTYSGLNITTSGCYTLTGDMALSLVRARHMTYYDNGRWHDEAESDLARIRRQQLFVKRVIKKAESSGLANVTAINGVVGGIVNNLTVDSSFSQKEMLQLARRYRSFNPDQLVTVTLPTTQARIAGNDVLLPIKDQDQTVINNFLGVTPKPAPATTLATVPASQITVGVLNGNGRRGEAASAAAALRAAGFGAAVSGQGQADSFTYANTVVRYDPSDLAKAQTLQAAVVGGATLQPDSSLPVGSLILVTGATYGGIKGATANPAAAGLSPTTTVAPDVNSAPAFPGSHGTDPAPLGSGC